MDFLKEASECNRSLVAPLTPEQLLLGAERMKQCNVLKLEQLLDDLALWRKEMKRIVTWLIIDFAVCL